MGRVVKNLEFVYFQITHSSEALEIFRVEENMEKVWTRKFLTLVYTVSIECYEIVLEVFIVYFEALQPRNNQLFFFIFRYRG